MENNTFLEGKIFSPLINFAIPLMLSLILQALYGAVDLMVVGHFGNTASVSAVATGSQVMQSITGIIIGLTTGVTVLIGQAIGACDNNRASEIVAGMTKLLLCVSLIISVGMIVFAEQAAHIMNVPAKAFAQTVVYIRICAAGTIFISSYNAISGIFRGIGNSKLPLLFIFIACIANIIGDIFLVGILKLDAAGAAIATVLAQAISVAFSVWYIQKNGLPFKITRDNFKSSEPVIAILKVGTPIALQDFLTSISFLIITSIINSLGLIASASIGISEKMFIFFAIVPMSFMSALSAFVAQNIGARQEKRATKSLFIAMSISFVFGTAMFLLTFFAGDMMAMIFEKDTLVIASTAEYLRGCSFEHLIISISFCFLGYFNGLGKTTFVMSQGLISSFLIRIPLSYYLSRLPNTGMFTIGLAVPASAFVSLALNLIYFVFIIKRKHMISKN